MKIRIAAFFGLLLFTGCMPDKILCMLNFSDYSKIYAFDCSKEELKSFRLSPVVIKTSLH